MSAPYHRQNRDVITRRPRENARAHSSCIGARLRDHLDAGLALERLEIGYPLCFTPGPAAVIDDDFAGAFGI